MALKQKIKIFDALYDEQKHIAADVFSKRYANIMIQAGRQSGKTFSGDRIGVGVSLHELSGKTIWCTPFHSQALDAQERQEEILFGKIKYWANHSSDNRKITFEKRLENIV